MYAYCYCYCCCCCRCRGCAVLLDKVTITFKQGDDELRVQADEGQTLLDVAMDNNVDIEGERVAQAMRSE